MKHRMEQQFKDRAEAGYKLAKKLEGYRGENAVVLGIPRGGVVTAGILAKELSLPLGLLIVRKIGHPYNSEFAIAAISESGQILTDKNEASTVDRSWFKKESKNQLAEAKRRREKYWGSRKPLSLAGKDVILIDDGLATGLTMKAAIQELKSQNPAKIVVAVPVSPGDTAANLKDEVDDFVSLLTPEIFAGSVGAYYEDFPQVDDDEVIRILNSN